MQMRGRWTHAKTLFEQVESRLPAEHEPCHTVVQLVPLLNAQSELLILLPDRLHDELAGRPLAWDARHFRRPENRAKMPGSRIVLVGSHEASNVALPSCLAQPAEVRKVARAIRLVQHGLDVQFDVEGDQLVRNRRRSGCA